MAKAVEFVNINKRFPGVHVLKDISFSVEEGEVHALLGEKGAGKSTLIRTINALEVPTSGQVLVDDEDINALRKSELRKKIGMIFRQFNLFETKTV